MVVQGLLLSVAFDHLRLRGLFQSVFTYVVFCRFLTETTWVPNRVLLLNLLALAILVSALFGRLFLALFGVLMDSCWVIMCFLLYRRNVLQWFNDWLMRLMNFSCSNSACAFVGFHKTSCLFFLLKQKLLYCFFRFQLVIPYEISSILNRAQGPAHLGTEVSCL